MPAPRTLGWLPELPDIRDYVAAPITVRAPYAASGMPETVDWRKWCSPVEDQGGLGSCVAQAVVGLAEFMQNRAGADCVDLSRLFVYKTSKNLLGWSGDTGMYVRTALKAMAAFGACPERYHPYRVEDVDLEPSAYCYAYAQRYRALRYYRFDTPGKDRALVLDLVKRYLVYSLPVVFGFVVYSFGDAEGCFPLPQDGQRPYGGHAVLAVGYDDNRSIGKSRGALLIRNSWGTRWGSDGYGWLPYDYVLRGMSSDFWATYQQDYLDI
jgi:C1A family cysteine protease